MFLGLMSQNHYLAICFVGVYSDVHVFRVGMHRDVRVFCVGVYGSAYILCGCVHGCAYVLCGCVHGSAYVLCGCVHGCAYVLCGCACVRYFILNVFLYESKVSIKFIVFDHRKQTVRTNFSLHSQWRFTAYVRIIQIPCEDVE